MVIVNDVTEMPLNIQILSFFSSFSMICCGCCCCCVLMMTCFDSEKQTNHSLIFYDAFFLSLCLFNIVCIETIRSNMVAILFKGTHQISHKLNTSSGFCVFLFFYHFNVTSLASMSPFVEHRHHFIFGSVLTMQIYGCLFRAINS